jgi:hypothetical protein
MLESVTDRSTPVEPLWRIAKWSEVFERAESRKLKQLTWIAIPTSFHSTGYQSLLEEFGDDAPAIYGAWVALCSYAASCHIRGVLGNSRGIPLKLSHIARITGFPVAVFARLCAWASRPDVGWLEAIDPRESPHSDGENRENPSESSASGESPDDPSTHRENPPYTRPDRTEPDRTEPDQTEPNIFRRSIDWAGRWSSASFEFRERVREAAMRLSRARGHSLDREWIWQACWVGTEFGRDALADAITRIAEGQVRQPKQYLGKTLVTMCEKAGTDWDRLRMCVPPVPPPSQPVGPVAVEVSA